MTAWQGTSTLRLITLLATCFMIYPHIQLRNASGEEMLVQASLFNKPRTGFNVMSASDAVGMGLNLNIRYPPSLQVLSAQGEWQYHLAEGRILSQLAESLAEHFPVCYSSWQSWQSAPSEEPQPCQRLPSLEENSMMA